MMQGKTFLVILIIVFVYAIPFCYSIPLSTNKRWIVDEITGERVKLACVNWPSHIGPMLAEGLDKKPLTFIISQVVKHQFNCVRFTWATYMYTRAQYAKLTVEQTFDNLNLTVAKAGIAKNNPFLLRMSVLQAFEAIVDVFGANGLMVILDNHMSQPLWCCNDNDGNGFQGDAQFHPEEWLRGLYMVAKRYNGKSQVIGIGMRNELRGPHQNQTDWYKYIQDGATVIHQVNNDVLVIASGLDYATNLSFLKEKPLKISNLGNKLVLEAHIYSWSSKRTNVWVDQPVNQVCDNETKLINEKVGFVNTGDDPVPLFFGEFGVNEKNLSLAEDHFLSCFLAYAAERDLDWALWALQGSYYYREGKPGTEEYFGILNANWDGLKNPTLQARLQLIKTKIQDEKNNSSVSYIMYHPQSGSCVHASKKKKIYTTNCKSWSRWTHDGEEAPIRLMGSSMCLKAVGDGLAPSLSTDCTSKQSTWRPISISKLHLAAKDDKGVDMCLHIEPSIYPKIVTRNCICIGNDPNCKDDPTSQWFKLVLTNVHK